MINEDQEIVEDFQERRGSQTIRSPEPIEREIEAADRKFSLSAIRARIGCTSDERREMDLPYEDSDIRYLLTRIDRLRGDLISLANHIAITLKDD